MAGVITDWSAGAERLFGFARAEALGQRINIIIPPDRAEAHDRGFEHWRRSGAARLERRIELLAQRKDGSPLDIELWMPEHITASMDAGADLHLPKPINAAALFDALNSVGNAESDEHERPDAPAYG